MLYGLRMPMPLPIGEPSGITAAQPMSTQAAREHGVVGRVGEHDEALVDELLGGAQQLGRVGQQRVLVADHLELDPVGGEGLAREPGGEHRVARGVAAGGVGQQLDAGVGEHVDQRAARGSGDRSAAARPSRARCRWPRSPRRAAPARESPPVPSSRRERSVRPAIVRVLGAAQVAASWDWPLRLAGIVTGRLWDVGGASRADRSCTIILPASR